MIPDTWFNTVGKQHMRNFCSQIERAYLTGRNRGLQAEKVNVDELFRIYRGAGKLFEDDEQTIRNLYANGVKKADIARRYGTSKVVIGKIVGSG